LDKDTICPLCEKTSLIEFKFWRVVENSFPYDRIASVHHMLIPKGHLLETELSIEAQKEFIELKIAYLNSHYDIIIEALPHERSIPTHHHYHLILRKEI
jgi:hypothetical protein